MARRVRILSVTILLAAGLISGCSPLRRQELRPPGDDPRGPSAPAGSVPTSYQPVPSDVLARQIARENGLAQAKYPEARPVSPLAEESQEPTAPAKPRISVGFIEPSEAEPATEPPAEDAVVLALKCFLNKRPEEAFAALERLDETNQEMLLGLLPLAARLGGESIDRAKPQELTALMRQIESLARPLRQRAPLRIERLCFCRQIRRFGCYEPLREEPATFLAASHGRDGELVRVYVEVNNFQVEQRGPTHVAHLTSQLEVRNYNGDVIWTHNYKDGEDQSRSPWQEQHLDLSFRIPPEMKPGHYTLWVQVQDVLTEPPRPPARRSLDFRVVASGSVSGP